MPYTGLHLTDELPEFFELFELPDHMVFSIGVDPETGYAAIECRNTNGKHWRLYSRADLYNVPAGQWNLQHVQEVMSLRDRKDRKRRM